MGIANVRNIIRAPGRLCYGATDLSADFPHGGTALGLARDIIFHYGVKQDIAVAEEFGGTVTKAYYGGEKPFLAAVLREFDNDALGAIFPNTVAGAVSGDRVVKYSPGAAGQNRPGYDLTDKQVKLVFSPLNVESHHFIILYYAIPAVEESAELSMSLDKEIGIGVVWWGGVDGSGRDYAHGKREDLASILS